MRSSQPMTPRSRLALQATLFSELDGCYPTGPLMLSRTPLLVLWLAIGATACGNPPAEPRPEAARVEAVGASGELVKPPFAVKGELRAWC